MQYYEYLDDAARRRLCNSGRQLSPEAQSFLEKLDARFAPLTELQRRFIFHWENNVYDSLKKGLKPSEMVQQEMPWLLKYCVLPRFHEALFLGIGSLY